MNRPYLSVMNGEVCEDFCSMNELNNLSMREIYSSCNNCIQYKNGNCIKGNYEFILEISKN
jgi:hypothetical protein